MTSTTLLLSQRMQSFRVLLCYDRTTAEVSAVRKVSLRFDDKLCSRKVAVSADLIRKHGETNNETDVEHQFFSL